jgi:hypothetical protein
LKRVRIAERVITSPQRSKSSGRESKGEFIFFFDSRRKWHQRQINDIIKSNMVPEWIPKRTPTVRGMLSPRTQKYLVSHSAQNGCPRMSPAGTLESGSSLEARQERWSRLTVPEFWRQKSQHVSARTLSAGSLIQFQTSACQVIGVGLSLAERVDTGKQGSRLGSSGI